MGRRSKRLPNDGLAVVRQDDIAQCSAHLGSVLGGKTEWERKRIFGHPFDFGHRHGIVCRRRQKLTAQRIFSHSHGRQADSMAVRQVCTVAAAWDTATESGYASMAVTAWETSAAPCTTVANHEA